MRAGSLRMDGKSEPLGALIASNPDTLSNGDAGSVFVEVDGTTILRDGARISSDTFGSGDAGRVEVLTGELYIDGDDQTGITTEAHSGSAGRAGAIIVTVDDLLELRNQGKISTSSFTGDAGDVEVRAGRLSMVGSGDFNQLATFIGSDVSGRSVGTAGTVNITVDGRMELADGALISVNNGGSGASAAGSVVIDAGELVMDGGDAFAVVASIPVFSEGDGGSVDITVHGAMDLRRNAEVSATSLTAGQGGNVVVRAESLRLDGGAGEALITSEARRTGAGGSVRVQVNGLLELVHGGAVSSATFAEGDGGSINIEAGELYIDSSDASQPSAVSSEARAGATGKVGVVGIQVDRLTLANGGVITIAGGQILANSTLATDSAGRLVVHANDVLLQYGGRITAASTGNVPASAIEIQADKLIIEGNSRITTLANEADGGPITIDGGILDLRDSLIETSVRLTGGDGGDITLAPELLVLDGGFIKANAAQGARGGDIFVDTQALVASGGEVQIDGNERLTF